MTRLLAVAGVVAALVALFVFGLLRGQPDRDVASNLVGKPVAAFTLPLYERYWPAYGDSLELADYLGKRPMVINFWASWCDPCYAEAPELQRAFERYGDPDPSGDGVLFIGVQTQDKDNRDGGRQFIDRFDLGFPNVLDNSSAVSVDYGVFGVPETFFVRADGTLAAKHVGPVTAEVLETQLAAIAP